MPSRTKLLKSLLALDDALADLRSGLSRYSWDSENELATLTRATALGVLQRYVAGDLPAATVEAWADTIEGREDVGYEAGFEALLGDLIHELANPDLTRPLTDGSTREWIGLLRT